MIERPEYMELLKKHKDHQAIKIITGVRRSGKSTILALFREYLKSAGVKDAQIISYDLDEPENSVEDWRTLYDEILVRLVPDKMNFVFIDEIQELDDFEKAVSGLEKKKNVDLYITGSNSKMLSSEIATQLSGRYAEIHVLPFSFKEYVSSKKAPVDEQRAYQEYAQYGGFPYLTSLGGDRTLIRSHLSSIYDSVLLKDIMRRKSIKDPLVLDSIVHFLYDNIGQRVSTNKIANTLNANGRSCSVNTVESYLNALVESHLFYKVDRYDIHGRDNLKTGDKYYACDTGLRNYILGEMNNLGGLLEDIIFLELIRQGYDVRIGKVKDREIDFVLNGEDGMKYVQVSLSVRDEATLERELASLTAIDDNYPKYLITLDYDTVSHDGIQQISAIDFLMGRVKI